MVIARGPLFLGALALLAVTCLSGASASAVAHPLDSDDDRSISAEIDSGLRAGSLAATSSSLASSASASSSGTLSRGKRTASRGKRTVSRGKRSRRRRINYRSLARSFVSRSPAEQRSFVRFLAKRVPRVRRMPRWRRRSVFARFRRYVARERRRVALRRRRTRRRRMHGRRRGGRVFRGFSRRVRARFPRRRRGPSRTRAVINGGSKLSLVGRGFASPSCRAPGEIWAVRTRDYTAYKYDITRKMVPMGSVRGGFVSVATTCGGQVYALSRFGLVYTHLGADRWGKVAAPPTGFVRIAAGADYNVLGVSRSGVLYKLVKRGWVTVDAPGARVVRVRDVSATCTGVIAAIDERWRIKLRDEKGKWRDLPKLGRGKPETVAVSNSRAAVVVTMRDGRVYAFRGASGWVRFVPTKLDEVATSPSGVICGTRGQNLFVAWGSSRGPRAKIWDASSLTPEPADPTDALRKDPFSGTATVGHHDAVKSPFAPATPTAGSSHIAFVRDNLPLAVTDFQKLQPSPAHGFEPFSMRTDAAKNGPVSDPLPDTKAEFQSGPSTSGSGVHTSNRPSSAVYDKRSNKWNHEGTLSRMANPTP